MDCRTALEILEVVRPDSADPMEPEVVEASDHVESCRRCEDHFLARRHFDRRLGEQMRDVPLPPGLKSRLLAGLEARKTSANQASDAGQAPVMSADRDAGSARRQRGRRRARLLAFATTALALMVIVTFFFVRSSRAPSWTLAELRHDARTGFQTFEGLATFDGDFEARLPEHGWETSRAISIAEPPRGFPPEAAPHPAALYYFVLRDGRRPPVAGVLLVTPRQNVVEPPQKKHFDPEGVGSGPLSTVAWTEGEFVYVCAVRGGGDSLERVARALRLTQAA